MSEAWLERLLRLVSATRDDELSCTECFDLLARYVDLETAGIDARGAMPALARHLHQCGVCREEHEVLRDLVRADAPGLPPGDDPPDSSGS